MWCHMSQYLIINILKLLLFWNNVGHLIQMFEWPYIMTHGPM